MNSLKKKIIENNKSELIKTTTCSSVLLSKFTADGVLSQEDVETIKAEVSA